MISSKKYGMDVDRFDYMMRDPLHAGQKDLVFNPAIYMDNFHIAQNQIVFNMKIGHKIFEFFYHRYRLFKNMYLNRKTIGFDYMIGDLLTLVEPEFKFSEAIRDPAKYLRLNNNIISDIEKIAEHRPDVKALVTRFYKRDIYHFVNEFVYGKYSSKRHSTEELLKFKELFLECQREVMSPEESIKLTSDMVILNSSMFKYCEENQFDSILVQDFDGEIKSASTISNLLNIKKYYEYQVHCFVKKSQLCDFASKTWNVFIRKYSHLLRIE